MPAAQERPAIVNSHENTSAVTNRHQRGAVQAIARSHQQCATSLELRASTSLARLWRDQGKVQQARQLLAPVYEWFTEGFDTRDLKGANALLEDLT